MCNPNERGRSIFEALEQVQGGWTDIKEQRRESKKKYIKNILQPPSTASNKGIPLAPSGTDLI